MLQSTNLEDYVYIQVNHLTNIFKLGARESTVTYVIKKTNIHYIGTSWLIGTTGMKIISSNWRSLPVYIHNL